MNAVGLTRGGFYFHFESRDELVLEALAYALDEAAAACRKSLEEVVPAAAGGGLAQLLPEAASSPPERNCSFISLAADLARSSNSTRSLFAKKLDALLIAVASTAKGASDEAARERAVDAIVTIAGTFILARAAGDKKLKRELLSAGRRLLGRLA